MHAAIHRHLIFFQKGFQSTHMVDMLMRYEHAVQLLGTDADFLHALCQLTAADADIDKKALSGAADKRRIALAAACQHHNL